MKVNDLCLKYDARITEEECRKILDGSSGSDSSSRPSSFPGSFSGSGMPGSSVNTLKIQNTISIVVCFVVVIAALVVLKFIKLKG